MNTQPRCDGCYDSFSGPWCDNCDQWPCICDFDEDESAESGERRSTQDGAET